MSDLDGMDAFVEVLDRLARAEARVSELMGPKDTAEAEVRRLTSENVALRAASRQDQDTLNREEAARTPKLKELWDAANAALGTVANNDDRARLHKAMEAARDYCDQLPF